jgi:hypothetical protein
VHAAEQERPDVAEARRQWKDDQARLDPAKLVFVDETGASTQMARLYGRARRGRRVVSRIPWGHWKTVTFVAGLRLDGITAPFAIDCAMNGAVFIEYLRQCLVPNPAAGRHRYHRQSARSQAERGARNYPSSRSYIALSAAL